MFFSSLSGSTDKMLVVGELTETANNEPVSADRLAKSTAKLIVEELQAVQPDMTTERIREMVDKEWDDAEK
jgi:hypothetical protein